MFSAHHLCLPVQTVVSLVEEARGSVLQLSLQTRIRVFSRALLFARNNSSSQSAMSSGCLSVHLQQDTPPPGNVISGQPGQLFFFSIFFLTSKNFFLTFTFLCIFGRHLECSNSVARRDTMLPSSYSSFNCGVLFKCTRFEIQWGIPWYVGGFFAQNCKILEKSHVEAETPWSFCVRHCDT